MYFFKPIGTNAQTEAFAFEYNGMCGKSIIFPIKSYTKGVFL